jgi:hypothetical protein
LRLQVSSESSERNATTTDAEAASKRGKAVSTVFAMQGVGNLMASLVMFILLKTEVRNTAQQAH